jgi:glutamine cyclotransferase
MRIVILTAALVMSIACSGGANNAKPGPSPTPAKSGPAPVYGYEVVKAYPHDPNAFTEGLFFHNGFLYESTGQEGKSSLKKVEIETGKTVQKWDLPKDDFGEGIALLNDKIYMLTWKGGLGRVFDAETFKLLKEFSYQGDGWGMTTDGTHLILDQSTHVLKFMDPETFKTVKTVPVMQENGKPLMQINELEWIKGEIWANIWHSEEKDILGKPNYIARIDPSSGKILGWIDLAGISPADQESSSQKENTLNGIAYDAANDRIFVTGKNWKKLYEIKITGPKTQ